MMHAFFRELQAALPWICSDDTDEMAPCQFGRGRTAGVVLAWRAAGEADAGLAVSTALSQTDVHLIPVTCTDVHLITVTWSSLKVDPCLSIPASCQIRTRAICILIRGKPFHAILRNGAFDVECVDDTATVCGSWGWSSPNWVSQ